jgi:molybdopterin converting factor small subunit
VFGKNCVRCHTYYLFENYPKSYSINGFGNICKNCNIKQHKLPENIIRLKTRKVREKLLRKREKVLIREFIKSLLTEEQKEAEKLERKIKRAAVLRKYEKTDKGRAVRRKYCKKRRLKDYAFKLRSAIGTGITKSLKSNNLKKNRRSWQTMVGYTVLELKEHLEKQFKEGMSWNNYTNKGWHIDHIRPVSSFNITSPDCEEFKKCWALENLQPLWAHENHVKSNKWNSLTTTDTTA